MSANDQLEKARRGELVRRNIHTYPFKYTVSAADDFFEPDLGSIYIHIPFCSTKCHFCDYTVYINSKQDLRTAYVEALKKEIRQFTRNRAFPAFRIDAIYFGGGTPGLLEAEQLVDILDTCRDAFAIVEAPEIAIEFDPHSVDADKLARLSEAGFNRVSIGAQAFDDEILKATNRPHNREDIYSSVEKVKQAGFTFFNLDLIYPLLGLDLESWSTSVDNAIDLDPACITAYPLEVWPHTAYHSWITKRNEQLPSKDEELEMANVAFDKLESAGFQAGSTSGYWHPERASEYCRFLTYYWRTLPMLGFGVSSKSVVYDRVYTNIKPIREYIERVEADRNPIDFSTRMTKAQEMRRIVIRGLKVGTVSRSDFEVRFGVPLDLVFGPQFRELVDDGFIEDDGEILRLTRRGQLFSNNVWESFYAEDDLAPPKSNEIQYGISELLTN